MRRGERQSGRRGSAIYQEAGQAGCHGHHAATRWRSSPCYARGQHRHLRSDGTGGARGVRRGDRSCGRCGRYVRHSPPCAQANATRISVAVVESEDLGTLTLIIWDMAFVPTRVFSTGFTLQVWTPALLFSTGNPSVLPNPIHQASLNLTLQVRDCDCSVEFRRTTFEFSRRKSQPRATFTRGGFRGEI